MTTKKIYGAVAAVCVSFVATGLAFGQACTANGTPITTPVSAVAHNNCNNGLTQLKMCTNGDTLNGAGIDIYQVTVGAGNNFSVTVSSSAFTPNIALTSTTVCGSNSPCKFDVVAPQAAAPFSATGNASALAAGNYFLFVADTGADAPGCGTYNLTVTAQLPVELKNFSVD